jgi:Zn-dependent protease with chaperone function
MIHLVMLASGWLVALGLRWSWCRNEAQAWPDRWNHTLTRFLLPPLLLITTAIALIWMGPWGPVMVHGWQGWLTYAWAIGFLSLIGFLGLQLFTSGWRSVQQMRQYSATPVHDRPARLLPVALPFVAQIGFWNPQLVVSQGLLDRLDATQLDAVLVHEAAHQHYRDTFWFFWLGWLRRCSFWLPNTEALWQELLLLREMRADRWAAQTVNPILLAEALLIVVSTPLQMECAVAFNPDLAVDRLEERINALLESPEAPIAKPLWSTCPIGLLVLLPLLVVPFHH